MKRTELQACRAWPAVRWSIFVLLVGSLSALAQEAAVLTVESVTVPPATKTTISVTVESVPAPGIASIQGQFSYDPKVLRVNDVVFPQIVGGSSVTVFNNTPESGLVRFAATLAGADLVGITEGAIVDFAVEAVGKNGDKSNLTLTVQVLSDVEYNPVPYQVVNGVFEIKELPPPENKPPVADFEFSPAQPSAGQTVQFTDKSKDPDGQVKSWKWDFGDGTTSTEQNPSHVYRTAGTFTVKLVVTDDKGAQSQPAEKKITVGPPAQIAVTITNYPNPAKDRTKFVYGWTLPAPARQATLRIFNIKGELVFTDDVDVTKSEFVYDLTDTAGRPLPNGPYFYVLSVTAQDNRVVRSGIGVLAVQR